ncbi:MAG TPA: hypothetical protein VH482_05480 [Thermomicrobiales bacterium]|jgi:hypothetical protein
MTTPTDSAETAMAATCDVCGQPASVHDDGTCPPCEDTGREETDVKTFTVSPRHGTEFTVEAETHEQAAERAAHKLHGNGTTARRTTGDRGKGGYFRAYRDASDSGGWKLAAVGEPFHVFED